MKLSEVRSRYIAFFKDKGHIEVPSAPIVPGNDPTTLFTSSGMQPLLPYFLGKDHPEGKRIVNSQLSFRTGDIEEVGDNRHTTFFEMLGNWSFGDYFKKEQLPWIFEFITDKNVGLGLDPKNIYVTVFAGDAGTHMPLDEEAVTLWKNIFATIGVDAGFANIGSEEAGYQRGMIEGEKIFAYEAKKNWWSRSGVPSNMPVGEPGGPDSELFYDFGTPHDPIWGEHCHPNCDCGRFVEIGNSVFMQYLKNTDGSFSPLPKQNVDFGGGLERLAFATLGTGDIFDMDVFDEARSIIEKLSGKTYAESSAIRKSFRIILDHSRASTFILAEQVMPSNTEAGYILRRLIRRSILEADKLGINSNILAELAVGYAHYYQDTYPHLSAQLSFIQSEYTKEETQFRKTLALGLKEFSKIPSGSTITGEQANILATTYGFPIELTVELANERGDAVDLAGYEEEKKKHQELSRAGGEQKFAGGLADSSEQTVAYHTTHHILLKVLQMVLGDSVHQRGSNITSERLRIDFAHHEKMTDEQKKKVESIVNEVLNSHLPVTRTVMKREEAEKLGAEMEFGVKYPDMVSVYSVGPLGATEENPQIDKSFSIEFCGGPHVTNTDDIVRGGKTFRILKEEASSAGVRRIKAVLE